MKKRTGLLPIYFSAIILAIFTVLFVFRGNFEFLVYAFTLFPLMWLIAKTDKIFGYTPLAKWGFAIWMVLHMAGGSLSFSGVRLYDTVFLNLIGAPYHILRYDQMIHIFLYFFITLFVYSIVSYFAKPKSSRITMLVITFLAAMGISALNEIVEFTAVVIFNSVGVGDYFNNALDLVFNALGIMIGLLFVNRKG